MSLADTAPPGLRAWRRSRRHPVRRELSRLGRARLFFDDTIGWRLSRGRGGLAPARLIAATRETWALLQPLSDDDLVEVNAALHISAEALLSREGAAVLALVLEVIRRETGLSLRDNQIECALRLLAGECVELRTGEGKSLAAALTALAAARVGIFTHVITVNDYLAARDHEGMAPMARRLGLTSTVVLQKHTDDEKRAAYDHDIVYGTNKTFVFDALRDLREARQGKAAHTARQMGRSFAVVDEVDSVLIDDATVPMILSEPTAEPPAADIRLFTDLLEFARATRPGRERSRDSRDSWRLTEAGISALAEQARHWSHPAARDDGLVTLAEMALTALHNFRDGVHYILREGEVLMIDQATGRLMEDRKWAYGMQQMVELKEGVPPSAEARTVGQITQQSFFRSYRHLAGLTGTAHECRAEFWSIYRLAVRPVKPHAPSRLKDLGLRIHRDAPRKWQAIAARAEEVARERSVLIGLNDVAEAEALRATFAARGREVAVLDALAEAQEAELVAGAGQPGRITIATHLAGRGTDIGLAESVRAAGGLHVIIASVMASGRLERQLYGRAGRQGDPGSYERQIALTDRGLSEGVPGLTRALCMALLRLRLFPRRALSRMQGARDGRALSLRRATLLREQELARQLGIR
ncbi:preprotein translocase subunit SecA [Oceanicola sp. S124]|uniref:preprotein translocase subunit SecA n=1 Tax=Oceanicola sp. S124 TaxID=1042378 RepID=UPI00025596E9|nr:preprotein translocase subunit SecA [Oceanicola sp. S124]